MSNRRNLWILAAIVVIAIILFMVMRPTGGGDGVQNGTQPSPHAIDQAQ